MTLKNMAFVLTMLIFVLPFSNAGANVNIWVINQEKRAQENAPITFAQIFAPGDVPAGMTLTATSAGGQPALIQVDAKARHDDGSLRHAVITLMPLRLAAEETRRIQLVAATGDAQRQPLTMAALLATGYDVTLNLNIGGLLYHASARDLLQNSAEQSVMRWLAGDIVTEWIVSSPVRDDQGNAHPHLTAHFHIRAYKGFQKVRTAVCVENDWTFVPHPSGFRYDATITQNGNVVYSKSGINHTHHARWRKVVWSGGDPTILVKHDIAYLFKTKAVPNYDRMQPVSANATAGFQTEFVPMSSANITTYMPTTGAHDDIGPLPRWAAVYLLTMDEKAKQATLVNGDAAGSFHIHYRNEKTGLPVTVLDYPYMTLFGDRASSLNPKTGEYEFFPAVSNGMQNYTPDDSHQPSLAFLPYLVTGDYYYLEELHFWANWNILMAHPAYREHEKGLLRWGQVRAQAWSLRTLAQAAYITPDDHPLKATFQTLLHNNIQYYIEKSLANSGANLLGYLDQGAYIVDTPYKMAPWEDDFFTWTIGYLVDLGYKEAAPYFQWKAKFLIGRLATSEYCWLQTSVYKIQVATAEGKRFDTFGDLFGANFSNAGCQGTSMSGYPDSPTGYGANLQPALALIVDARLPGSDLAWQRYASRNPKQDYSMSPQFSVVPKTSTFGDALAPPVISPAGGTFEESVKVTLSNDSGADIFYTLDGSTPDESATLYQQPILISKSSELEAISISADRQPSTVVSASFTITADLTPPSILAVTGYLQPPKIDVEFSEAVDSVSAVNLDNYQLDNGAVLRSAEISNDFRQVFLDVVELNEALEYHLTLNNIRDLAQKPNTIATNTVVSFNITGRVRDGLVTLYNFSEKGGDTVHDVSGIEPAMDLQIEKFGESSWGGGFFFADAQTILRASSALKLINACKAGNEITLEAWIRPASTEQDGPARIMTLSKDPYERDFTLGQSLRSYQVRLRTSNTGLNGLEFVVESNSGAATRLMHLLYTRSASDGARLFINAHEVAHRSDVGGSFSTWSDYQFALANELDGSRPWQGEIHLAAVYSRALTQAQVMQNYEAGPFSDSLTATPGQMLDTMPTTLVLHQNYPNPFNLSTTIKFDLPGRAHVKVTIYTMNGRHVSTPAQGFYDAGEHRVMWDAIGFSSGLYLARLWATMVENDQQNVRFIKMLVIK